MIAREGLRIILISFFLAFTLTILTLIWPFIILKILCWISLFLFLLVLYFFRDPIRRSPVDKNVILAPADGRIIVLDQKVQDDFVGQAKQISIFLSIFDVHSNRIPYDGKVQDLIYNRGQFLPAFRSKASFSNENLVTCIAKGDSRFKVKQISGLIARRIVNHLQIGDEVKKGTRFGMIKFGSRVDLFLPREVTLKVRLNQHIKAGETIIAELP